MDDRKLDKWKEWWRKHEYLRIGILMNLLDKIDSGVMFRNPFDGRITIA